MITQTQKDFILNSWLPALRSGKYEQGEGKLRTPNDEYCCLGVACDVYARANSMRWSRNKYGKRTFTFMGQEILPASQFFLGVTGIHPSKTTMQVNDRVDSLWRHNDSHGATFFQIADGIEAWVNEQEVAV